MRIEIVSGIWPPDIGGPASHAPEVAAWLRGRGHVVEALVTASKAPAAEEYPVRWVSRRLPVGVRHLAAVRALTVRARRADVIYATGMIGRSSIAAALARTPLVLKLTSDPAFERAARRGIVAGEVSEFQDLSGGSAVAALRAARNAALRRAAHIVCPSAFMAELAVSWGVPEHRITVLPNAAPLPDEATSTQLDDRPAFVFAGRLTPQKDLDVALHALALVPEATLTVAGEGGERLRLEAVCHELGLADRVRFVGALPRATVLGLMRAADVVVLTSAWENFPHGLVEALAMGTPVIATRAGGVPEIIEDGRNGLLVEPGDAAAFAAAMNRFLADAALQERLRAAARPSVARFQQDAVYGRLEDILRAAA